MFAKDRAAHAQNTFDVVNPYSRKKVGTVSMTSTDEINLLLKSANEFRQIPSGIDRASILKKVEEQLRKHKEDFAMTITSESGLSLKDTLHEVDRTANVAHFASLIAEKIETDTSRNYELIPSQNKIKLKVITEPLGLVVAITPFNHPLNQVAHKILPAIAAGACIILKPSSKTPLSALKLHRLLLKAGLPKEMCHVVTGMPADKVVDQLVSFPNVDMVTFTGGLEVGLRIVKKMVNSGNALKKTVLELGGCSALIVNDDADIERATEVAQAGCFSNSGQRCTAIRRIIVLNKVANTFVGHFTRTTKKLKCGDPFDRVTDMGTLISEEAAKSVEKRVNGAIKDGAKLILGNERRGALYPPTILDFVHSHSELVAHETFGPVGAILRVETLDQAIQVANQTNYRLAGAIITRKKETAEKVSNQLGVGQFSWNGTPSYRTECAPFGGFKNSGNGEKEGVLQAAYGMRRIRTFYEH